MTVPQSQMKLKSNRRGEEDNIEIEDVPVSLASQGRPTWWFVGSWFRPKTANERRWARLQYHTVAQQENVLSERATRIRQYISLLSEWFPIPLLDAVGKEILCETKSRQTEEKLLLQFLGAVEAALRKRAYTIRWHILHEISQATNQKLDKKALNHEVFYRHQRKKEPRSDLLRIVQRLTLDELAKTPLAAETKRDLYQQVTEACHLLRAQKFICKDPEITAWALKRILLEEKGPQKNLPQPLRTATSRMTFRLRQLLQPPDHA